MKKVLMILALCCTFFSFADDGGVRHPAEWTWGNIYVKDSNPDVSLENEFMSVCQEKNKVRSVFDFKNLTQHPVNVPCAFPVVIKVPYQYDGEKIIAADFRVVYDQIAFGLAFDKKENVLETDPSQFDKKVRVLSISEYKSFLQAFSDVDDYEVIKEVYDPVKLSLNGKSVPVTQVGIETEVVQSTEMKDYYGSEFYEGELTLKIHFYHELNFAPGKSILEAEYKIDTRKGARHGEVYDGFYDISTGGTWNGSMKNFVLISDGEIVLHNSKAQSEMETLFGFGGYSFTSGTILSIKNYKPSPDEFFEFKYSSYYEDMIYENLDPRKAPDFVKNVSASSFLKGTFTVNGEKYDYAPSACFDGKVLNGWVEGVPGDGIGQWIQFTLTETVYGPFMLNGLTRNFLVEHENYDEKYDDDYDMENFYWKENNRIKKMTLENVSNGTKKTITLADVYAGTRSFGETEKRWLDSNASRNPFVLGPGTYRLYIDDVYKGTKWDDTVLGEVWFYRLGKICGEAVQKENGNGFFTKEIEKALSERAVRADANEEHANSEISISEK